MFCCGPVQKGNRCYNYVTALTKGKAQLQRAQTYLILKWVKLLIHICYWIIFKSCTLAVGGSNTIKNLPEFCEWKTKRLCKLHTSKELSIFFRHWGCWIFSIFTLFNMFCGFFQQPSNQWYWRSLWRWRHSVKILFQQFIYPRILIQIFRVCNAFLCQSTDRIFS